MVLVEGLTGTQAVALTTAGTETIARCEPIGLTPTSSTRWVTAVASADPAEDGLDAGRVTITVYGSFDGSTWEDVGGGATPAARTMTDRVGGGGTALFSADDLGGDNWFARVAVDWFPLYKVVFSGVTEVAPAVTYDVFITDCERAV